MDKVSKFESLVNRVGSGEQKAIGPLCDALLSMKPSNPPVIAKYFELILLSDHKYASNIMKCLGLLAAEAGMEEETEQMVLSMLENNHEFDAIIVCRRAMRSIHFFDKRVPKEILTKLSKSGYLASKVVLMKSRLLPYRGFGKILMKIYMIIILVRMSFRYLFSPDDPKIKMC